MKKLIFAVLILLTMSPPVLAASREGKIQAGAGFGLGVHPLVRFDLQLNGEYFLYEDISIGMNVDFLFRGGTAFGFTPFARYHFDIASLPELVPYVGGGLGAFITTNGNGTMDIMIPDFGFKYELISERLFIGPDLSFHVVTNFDNTSWDFRFLFAVASYRF